jgi:hypothetical protein
MPGARNADRWSLEAGEEPGKQLANDVLDVFLLAAVLLMVALVTVL